MLQCIGILHIPKVINANDVIGKCVIICCITLLLYQTYNLLFVHAIAVHTLQYCAYNFQGI